jgi:hypothetical protein
MELINRIFTQDSPHFSGHNINLGDQIDTIYTLENIVQTLEEAAYYLVTDNSLRI